jgi:hypothetical protein
MTNSDEKCRAGEPSSWTWYSVERDSGREIESATTLITKKLQKIYGEPPHDQPEKLRRLLEQLEAKTA